MIASEYLSHSPAFGLKILCRSGDLEEAANGCFMGVCVPNGA